VPEERFEVEELVQQEMQIQVSFQPKEEVILGKMLGGHQVL
jgi:hypothetical protein